MTKSAIIGVALVGLVGLGAILAGWLAPHDPLAQDLSLGLRPPLSAAFPLGSDSLGRDLLSRILFGARVSLAIGVSAVLVQGSLGTLLGLLAGYIGGTADMAIMRLADLQLSIPPLILAIGVMAVVGPSVANLILILGVAGWPYYARLVRSEVLSLRQREFIEAARCIGCRDSGILLRHVLPNVAASLIVLATFFVPLMIIQEAVLSFVGLGVPPSVPSWGSMVADGRDFLSTAWWIATLPGLAIFATVVGINLVGDWLRDVLDPRQAIHYT
ncbi:MAG: ABC transporter permease [Chloroflexota bacterium]